MQVADYQSPTVLANYVLLLSYLSKVLKYSTKANYSIQNFWCQCLSGFVVAQWHILDLFPLNTEHFLNTPPHASLMVRRPPPRPSIQQTFKPRPFTCAILNNLLWFHISGEFTCRVDFRQSPTKYHRVRLTVIGEWSMGIYFRTGAVELSELSIFIFPTQKWQLLS